MQELQFEYFIPLEHAEAAMQATWDVTKDWHLPPSTDPDGRPFANVSTVDLCPLDQYTPQPLKLELTDIRFADYNGIP